MMNKLGVIALALAISSVASATVHFYDGFETVTAGSPVDATIWNAPSTAGTLIPTVEATKTYLDTAANTVTVNAKAGNGMAFIPGQSGVTRFRNWGNITPAVDTNTSICVFSYWYYDSTNAASSGNSRWSAPIHDYLIDNDRASGLSQLVNYGIWNSYNAPTSPINSNGGTQVGSTEVGRRFMARLVSSPGSAPQAVGYVSTGVDDPATTAVEDLRRTTGWHQLMIVYGASQVEWYVDGVKTFYWTHGKPATFDQIALTTGESSFINAFVDEMYVESMVPGTLRFRVELGDYVGDPTQAPLTVELIDPANPLNNQTLTNQFVDARGHLTITPTAPAVYDVRVRGSHWLWKQATGVDLTGMGSFNNIFSLINGDIDGDNEVGPGDFGGLALAFLSVAGDPNWNAEADLDGDGEVGPGDFGILANNFLLGGD